MNRRKKNQARYKKNEWAWFSVEEKRRQCEALYQDLLNLQEDLYSKGIISTKHLVGGNQ